MESDWRPRATFSRRSLGHARRFGLNLLGFNLANYAARNLDDILIGRVMGAATLGLYSRAYGLMMLLVGAVSAHVGQVMFPGLSSIQTDPQRVKGAYLRCLSAIAYLTFPMALGLATVADPFVRVVLGEQWAPIVTTLQIFCIVGLVQSIGTTAGWIYTSQGRTDLFLRWGLVWIVPLLVGIAIGVALGSIESVAGCYAVAAIAVEIPSLHMAGKIIGMKVSEVLRAVGGAFALSAAMALLVWAVASGVPDTWPPWLTLALAVVFGIAVYAVALDRLAPAPYRDVRRLLTERLAQLGDRTA